MAGCVVHTKALALIEVQSDEQEAARG